MEKIFQDILQLKNISIGYGKTVLLEDINITIPANSIVALLGLNGTGKSSLLRTIAGLQKEIRGDIFLFDKILKNITAENLSRQIGIVLSGRGEIVQSLTVKEILRMARAPYTGLHHILNKEDDELIAHFITLFHLEKLILKPVYQLSDGEMQKVMIAKVLIQETPLILMDEPTSHLDIIHKIEIFSLLKKLKAQNKTVLFASHELDLAIQIADFCILLDHKGNYVFDNTENLIANDQFGNFFNSENFKFNPALRKFETRIGS